MEDAETRIPADELARVICMAEALPSGSASLFQELAASLLLYRPLVLRDESFLVRIAQDSPRSLALLIAAQQDCSRLSPEEVHLKRATRKLCDLRLSQSTRLVLAKTLCPCGALPLVPL